MKTITSLIFSILLLLSSGFGSFGTEKTEVRNLSGFSSINVSTGIDLFITMGNVESVKVVADDDIIDQLKTEVEDGTLKIYMKSRSLFSWNWNKVRKVYVQLKTLEKLDASSGSDVVSENTLRGSKIAISTSSGSDVKLDLVYDEIKIDSSSGSDAELSGECNLLEAHSSSGSDIDAADLESKVCHASASSGADAVVNASDEIHADASSGADIRYIGNPANKDLNESSGGDVTRK